MSTTVSLNDVDIESVAGLANGCTEDASRAATTWKAEVTWTGGFRSESRIRDFGPIPSDEPEGLAGTNQAPTPVEQLQPAVGNCRADGVAGNATARGISIRRLTLGIEGNLDSSPSLGSRPGPAGFDGITASIDLDCD